MMTRLLGIPYLLRCAAIGATALPSMAPPLHAQQPDTASARPALPREVAREAIRLFNEPAVLRADSPVEIAEGREIRGDVAVRNGLLVVGGRVMGRVLAINTDVRLLPTGRIDGDLLVVGGRLIGSKEGIAGEVRTYSEALGYRVDGERIVGTELVPGDPADEGWLQRWARRRRSNSNEFSVASAGVYNRVEGLPVLVGPQLYRDQGWGSWQVSARTIVRTGSSPKSGGGDLGHDASSELRLGRRGGAAVRARVFNVVAPVEEWQLNDLETTLAAFIFKRDYRDYFSRHGANLGAAVLVGRRSELGVRYGHERWGARVARNPFAIFSDDVRWRPNPMMDEGRLHLTTVALRTDTRNSVRVPRSGWLLHTEWEHGRGELERLAPTSPGVRAGGPGALRYSRGFLDARRYNRLAPDEQVNLRLVLGGWLGGDALPLQRRLSIDGPGTVPGFDFRRATGSDVGTCRTGGAPPGLPAQCDRIALLQAEYRSEFGLGLNWEGERGRRARTFVSEGAWVFFANGGRGWLVGAREGVLRYPSATLPPLSSFRTDIGAGVDFGVIAAYVAKALSAPGEPLNVLVRLRHRF